MTTINETKRFSKSDKLFGIFTIVSLFLVGILSAERGNIAEYTASFLILFFGIFFLSRKRTLRLTIVDNSLIIEKSISIFIPKIKKTILDKSQISRFIIRYNKGKGMTYVIEIIDKTRHSTFLVYYDIETRARVINFLIDFLEKNQIKIEFYTTIYDPSFETLKNFVSNNYNLVPNKFNPDAHFDGKKYL